MKKRLLLVAILLIASFSVNAQSKLVFVYDAAGNQNQRYYCDGPCAPPPPPPPIAPPKENLEAKEDVDLITQFAVFPNPTTGMITVQPSVSNQLKRIQIYNSISSLIKEVLVNSNSTSIDLTNYPSGFYLIRFLQKNGKVITKKIIKN